MPCVDCCSLCLTLYGVGEMVGEERLAEIKKWFWSIMKKMTQTQQQDLVRDGMVHTCGLRVI